MQYSREWIASNPTVNVIALNKVLRTNESVAPQVGFTSLQEIRLKFHQYFLEGGGVRLMKMLKGHTMENSYRLSLLQCNGI